MRTSSMLRGNSSLVLSLLAVVLLAGMGQSHAGFIPTDVAGLTYWLNASDVDGDGLPDAIADGTAVGTWRGKTNAVGVFRDFTQATAASQPLYYGTAVGGKPVLRFDGTDDRLTYGSATSPATVFIVNKPVADSNLRGIWGSDNPADKGIRMPGAAGPVWSSPGDGNDFVNPQGTMFINGTAGSSFGSLGTPHVLEAARGTASPATYNTTQLGWYYSGRVFSGDVAEAVVYDRALTAYERNAIGYYLGSKYGLTTSYLNPDPDYTLTWSDLDDNWGTSNWTSAPPGGPAFPNAATVKAVVNNNRVVVEGNYAAYSLAVGGTGEVNIGANNTLTLSGMGGMAARVDVTGATAALSFGADAKLVAGGGTVATLKTLGNATVDTSGAVGTLLVNKFDDQNTPGTFRKLGAGTLAIDNTLGTSDAGDTTFRVEAGTLRAIGATPLAGSTAVTLNGGTLDLQGAQIITAGLREGALNGAFNEATPNPGYLRQLGVRMGQFSAKPPWYDNQTWVYTGQVYDADGVFSFAENIDDNAKVVIDGVQRIRDTTWNNPATTGIMSLGMGPMGDGWHDVEIRLGNGGGGAGAVAGNGWTATYGFGIAVNGSASNQGTAYVAPVDPGNASLFRTVTRGPVDASATTVTVLSNSALNVVTDSTATVGSVVLSNGTTLATSGGNTVFNQLSVTGGAGRSATLSPANQLTVPGYNDGGVATTLTKGGTGALTMDNSAGAISAASTTFAVPTGTLKTLGTLGGGAVSLTGGTLQVKGAPQALTTTGLVFRLDAADLDGNGVPDVRADGSAVSTWQSVSPVPNALTAPDAARNAAFYNSGIGGKPVVRFNGSAYLYSATYDMPANTAANPYTILAVSDLSGDQNARLISSQNINWLLGYHGNWEGVMHANAWVTDPAGRPNTYSPPDSAPDIYAAACYGSGANWGTRFYKNGLDITVNPIGGIDRIGKLALGGYGAGPAPSEASKGDVAEVLVYNRVLTPAELYDATTFLANKYGIPNNAVGRDLDMSATTVAVAAGTTTSAIVADSKVTFGTLTLGNASTLTTSGQEVRFPQTILAGTTATLAANNRLYPGLLDDGGADKTLIKRGTGTAVLDNLANNTAKTTFRIEQGTLSLDKVAALGGTGSAAYPITLAGGTFEVKGDPVAVNNALSQRGFHVAPPANLDLHNNGGLMTMDPYGRALLQKNIIAFSSDRDFMSTGAIAQWDNYMNMWYGYLNVPAAGTYNFRTNGQDDYAVVWVDINGDGIFKSNTGALATNNGELVLYNETATRGVTFAAPGKYMVAVLHGEGGGDSNIAPVQIQSPSMGALSVISPSHPAQAGLWSTDALAAIDLSSTNVTTVASTSSVLRAVTDYDAKFGPLNLATSSTLALSGAKMTFASTTFNPGSILSVPDIGANIGAAKTSGGTSTIQTTTGYAANITPGLYVVTPSSYDDQGIAGSTMRITGGATLALDNTVPDTVKAGRTTFQVDTGSRLVAAPTVPATPALGATGNPVARLVGGTLDLRGLPDGGSIPNALSYLGYHVYAERSMNLDGSNGILGLTPYNRVRLTTGPAGAGLNYSADADFLAAGAVGQVDTFTNTFVGYLNVPAPGTYQFQTGGGDDRNAMWIDLNGNGKFEATTGGLETNNGELIAWRDNGAKTVNFTAAGKYLVAVELGEFGGAQTISASIKTPSMAALTVIKPSDPAQAGLWSVPTLGPINAANANVSVAASSTISALTDKTASLGTLTFESSNVNPVVLTASGGGTVKFAGTNLASPSPAVSYNVPAGTVGNQNNFTGSLGMDFDLVQPLTLTSLGVFDSGGDGLTKTFSARIYDRNNTAAVYPTLTFPAGTPGTVIGGSRFLTLPTPIALPAGFRGSIVADGFGASDPDGNAGTITWTMNTANNAIQYVGGGRWLTTSGTIAYPTNVDGGPANRYAAGTFQFVAGTYGGINVLVNNTVYPGPLNGAGATNLFFTQGMGDVILDQPGTALQNTTIEARGGGGRLILTNPAAVAGAKVNIGTPVPSATGALIPGQLVFTPNGSPQTYPNQIGATASGTLIGGPAAVMSDGNPLVIGSTKGSIILPNLKPTEGAVITMRDQISNCCLVLPNGVNSPSYTVANALAHYGYHINNDPVAMNLNNNAGMLNLGKPEAFQTFFGKEILTSGPGNRGLDYNDDIDFIAGGAVGQVDNYSNLFIGKLTVVDAAQFPTAVNRSGNWNFRINAQDDPCGIWIDLNRNGVFQSSDGSLNNDRAEELLWNGANTRTVNLAAGDYMVAFTHREGGIGSQIEAQFQAPGMAALAMVKPSDAAQAGFWSMPVLGGGLDIVEGETRTLGDLSLSTLTLSPGGMLNRSGRHDARDLTITDNLNMSKDLAMTIGRVLDTRGATVNINPGATLYVDQPVNAADLNVLGNLVRTGSVPSDITATRSLTLGAELDMTKGGALNTTSADITVNSTGKLTAAAPLLAKSLTSAGTVATPGATMANLTVTGGTTTLTGNLTLADGLRATGGTLVTQGNLTINAQKAISFNGQLRVDSGTLNIIAPAAPSMPAGLAAWYDANDINAGGAQPANGAVITSWLDKSGNARFLGGSGQYNSDPNLNTAGPNGKSVVTFDGDDWIRSAYNLDPLTNYSVLSVARYTVTTPAGDTERVISSTGRNWLFGFYGAFEDRWHAEGWIYPPAGTGGTAVNTNWYLHAGTMGPATNNPPASFWSNGKLLAVNDYGSGDANYMIGQLELGAYNSTNETSRCEVAEVLIFNRVLAPAELNSVGGYLATKYGLGTSYTGSGDPWLGDVRLAGGTQVTIGGSGKAGFNSLGASDGGPIVSGGMIVSGSPAALSCNPAADTVTLDATISAGSFNVTGPGTIALTNNLTVASGGRFSVAQDATLATLNTLAIDASQANVDYKGALNVASGPGTTLTLRTPAVMSMPMAANNIGYWRFNEGTGTTTADASGAGNAGTIVANAAWVNDPQRGTVLNFPASGSVTIPAAAFSSLTGGSEVTISLWQYGAANQPRQQAIFEARNAAGNRILNSHLPWDNANVYWDAGNLPTPTDYDRINKLAGTAEYKSQWNNWVFRMNKTTSPVADELAIYLNGALWHTSGATDLSQTIEAIASFRIGAYADGTTSYSGMIDDFMAWNRSLSLADIQNVYAAGRLGGFGVKSFGNLTMAPDTTLDLANAAGLSGAGAAAFDSIRTAGNATIKGDVTNRGIVAPGASPGTLTITGNFAMDTGSTYQWETVGTAPGQSDLIAVSGNLDLSKNWAVAATPRAAVPSGTYNVMTYGGALTPGGTATVTRGAGAYGELVNLAGSSVTSGGGNVALNLAMNPLTEWNSAGTDWDQPPNWTNGLPSATKAAVVNTSGQIATVTAPMGLQQAETLIIDNGGHVRVDGGNLQVMGNAWVEPTGSLTVNSTLKVGSTVLLPGPSGLVGYWPLNEGSGTTAGDATAGGRNGTFSGGATWVTDPVRGTVVQFNGTDGKIDVPYSAALNPTAFTFQCWANVMGGANTFRSPVTSRDDGPQRGYISYAGDNNVWQYWTGTGSGWVSVQGPAVSEGTWVNLAGTYDGSMMRFYINGALVGSSTNALGLNTARPLRIGAGATEGGGNYWFNGLVDDVAVWNRALSAADILALYQTGPNSVPLPLVPTLVGGTLTTAGTTIFGPDANLDIPVINVVGGTTTFSPSATLNVPLINVTGGTTTGLGTPGTPHATLAAGTTLKLAGGNLAGTFEATNTSKTAGSYAYEIESGTSSAALLGANASLRKSTAGTATFTGPITLDTMSIEAGSMTLGHAAPLTANALNVSGGSLTLNRDAQLRTLGVTGGTMTTTRNIALSNALSGGGTLVTDGTVTLDVSSAAVVNFTGTLRVTDTQPASAGRLTINVPTGGGVTFPGGLLYRLDAAAGVVTDPSGNVQQWTDQTANGRNFLQATLANQPDLVPNALNGLPVVRFDGADDRLTLSTATSPYSVFIVNSSNFLGGTGNPYLRGIWGSDNPSDKGIRGDPVAGSASWRNPGDGNDFTNPQGTMFINGAPGNSFGSVGTYNILAAVRGTAHSTTYNTTQLGWYYDLNRVFGGDIAEVLVFDSALSANDMNNVGGYLASKYGIASSYTGGLTGVPLLGNLRLDPGTELSLGGAGQGAFDSIGTTGGPTVSGGLTLAGANPNVQGGTQGLIVNGTLAARSFNVTGPGTVTLRDNLSVAPGGRLDVPAGTTLASQGNVVIDASSAIPNIAGTLKVASGTLTLNAPAGGTPVGAAAYYSFDNVSGTTVVNGGSLGASKNGVLTDGATITGGKLGNGMAVADDSNQRLVIGGNVAGAGIDIGAEWTLASWFNNLHPANAWRTLCRGAQNDHQVIVRDTNNDLGFYDNARGANFMDSLYDLLPGQGWHHIAAVGKANDTTDYYIDGVLVGTVARRSTTEVSTIGNYLTGGQPFAQTIDEFVLYNQALSPNQIAYLYKAGLGGGYGPARFGNLDMAAGTQLIIGGSGAAGFTSVVTGAGASISGNVTVDSRLNVTGTLPIGSNLALSDGMVFEWDIVKGPRDLVNVLGDLKIDKSFTLRLFGAGGSISPDELIPVFLYSGGLYVGSDANGNPIPWNPQTNPLQYLIDIGNIEDPNNLYIWDICDTNLQILNLPSQGIYLTGLTAELIPEPTTLTLLGLGALALLRRRRRAA